MTPASGCGRGCSRPAAASAEAAHRQLAAERREARQQRRAGVVGGDRRRLDQQDRAGVEAGVHLHQGDAGLGVAGLDRPLDRRGAAPARQQRRMDVDAAEPRQREQPRRQDQAVGGDDDRLGRGGDERRPRRRGVVGEAAVEAQPPRLRHRQAVRERERLDRRRLDLHAAAGGPVGLAEHERDLVAGGVQPLQPDAREFRRAGEREAHRSPP